jgi:hypothetical protein
MPGLQVFGKLIVDPKTVLAAAIVPGFGTVSTGYVLLRSGKKITIDEPSFNALAASLQRTRQKTNSCRPRGKK